MAQPDSLYFLDSKNVKALLFRGDSFTLVDECFTWMTDNDVMSLQPRLAADRAFKNTRANPHASAVFGWMGRWWTGFLGVSGLGIARQLRKYCLLRMQPHAVPAATPAVAHPPPAPGAVVYGNVGILCPAALSSYHWSRYEDYVR